jgi:GNAT superfamily N-acetyltransferase
MVAQFIWFEVRPTFEIIVGSAAIDHRAAVLNGLVEFNSLHAAPSKAEALCVALRDTSGVVIGGLFGKTIYDWLAIEHLFVPEQLRKSGTGTRLLATAEQQARECGCIGAWLDTFSFQARGFYERLGYSVVGTIPDHPKGGARYFMMKRWSAD